MKMDGPMARVVDTKMESLMMDEKVEMGETKLKPLAMIDGGVVATLPQMEMDGTMAKVVDT